MSERDRDPALSDLPLLDHILTPEEFRLVNAAFDETSPCGREALAQAYAKETDRTSKPAQEFEMLSGWRVQLYWPGVTRQPRWEAQRGDERFVNPMPVGTSMWDTFEDAKRTLEEPPTGEYSVGLDGRLAKCYVSGPLEGFPDGRLVWAIELGQCVESTGVTFNSTLPWDVVRRQIVEWYEQKGGAEHFKDC